MFNIVLAVGMFVIGIIITLAVLFLLGYKYFIKFVKEYRKLTISINKNRKRLIELDAFVYGLMSRFDLVAQDPTDAPTMVDDEVKSESIVKSVKVEIRKDVKPLTRDQFASLSHDEKLEYISQYKDVLNTLPNKDEVLDSLKNTTVLDQVYRARCCN